MKPKIGLFFFFSTQNEFVFAFVSTRFNVFGLPNIPIFSFDTKGVTHRRLEIMEQLQDQMVEAAKQRGTR